MNEKKQVKIAYITADWNRELVSIALEAVKAYINTCPEIRVQVFNCFGFSLHGGDPRFRYKIYDLPNFKDYDALIIQAHQIVDSSALKSLETRVAEAGIPAVSIGTLLNHCIYIGTNDYRASADMTEHLIRKHNARSFLFIKGLERDGYGEAHDRRRGFEDVCRKNGIDMDSIRYYEGDWQSDSGKRAARELLASGESLPDAIVSANDEMALGAMGVLNDAGIRIPEDVLVTGFDDINSAALSDPRLTTVGRDFPQMIHRALDLLLEKLQIKSVSDHVFSPHKMIFSESCGCFGHSTKELQDLRRQYYNHSRRLESYYAIQDDLTARLFAARDAYEVLDIGEHCSDIFGSPRMYLFVNDFYYDQFLTRDIEVSEETAGFSNEFVLTCVSNSDMEHDERHAYMRISRKDLTDVKPLSDEQFTIFYPMHFEGIMIGFLVLTSPPTVTEMNLHESIVNLMVFAIENLRRKLLARRMNESLDALSVTDALSGLHNRFGYERFGERLLAEIRADGRKPRVLFLDIDNMKQINDVHGHVSGDAAIRAVARLMRESCRKSDFKMRYGGDEFLIITEGGEQNIQKRFEEKLDALNASNELGFPLSVSIGCYIADENGIESTRDILIKADKLMYEVKSLRKGARAE